MANNLCLNNPKNCIICKSNKSVINVSNEPRCEQCFIKYFCYKVKYNLKNKLSFTKNTKTLYGLSLGLSSLSLLEILSTLNKNNLIYNIDICHIDESCVANLDQNTKKIKETKILSQKYKCFKFFVVPLEIGLLFDECSDCDIKNVLELYENNKLYHTKCDLFIKEEKMLLEKLGFSKSSLRNKLLKTLDVIKSDNKIEYINLLRIRLLCNIAKLLNYEKIMVGENSKKTAKEFVKQTILGNGFYVKQLIGFQVYRFGVPILFPLHDIEIKFIAFYAKLLKINEILNYYSFQMENGELKNSLDYLIADFMEDISEKYNQTVTNVINTLDKIEPAMNNFSTNPFCVLCGLIMQFDKTKYCSMCHRVVNESQVLQYNGK